MLTVEHTPSIPLVSKVPTIILGMDVSHGSPGHSDVPSIAAVCILLNCSSSLYEQRKEQGKKTPKGMFGIVIGLA